MFTCHNPRCGKDCRRIIGSEGNLFCENCFSSESIRPTYLHRKDGNPWSPKMTVAKAKIIDNRVVSRDDNKTILDRRTGRPSEY